MIELDEKQKVELIRYRHEDQCRLLYNLSQTSLKIFSGFLTLQLAFGSFLTQITPTFGIEVGFILMEIAICSITTFMLLNIQRRRREAARTVRNCNEYLGFDEEGAYLPDRAINFKTKFWHWFPLYTLGIWLSFVGILFILLSGDATHRTTPDRQTASGSEQAATVEIDSARTKTDNPAYFLRK